MQTWCTSCGRKDLSFIKVFTWQLRIHKSYIWQNFMSIWAYLYELLPKHLPNMGPTGSRNEKNCGVQKVKSKIAISQKLKLKEPETMDWWFYYKLRENFCWPFCLAPGNSQCIFWCQKKVFLLNFTRILWFF